MRGSTVASSVSLATISAMTAVQTARADCGAAAIGTGGDVSSGASGVAADDAGGVTSAGTFLTDEAEVCGATDCPLSLRSQ